MKTYAITHGSVKWQILLVNIVPGHHNPFEITQKVSPIILPVTVERR